MPPIPLFQFLFFLELTPFGLLCRSPVAPHCWNQWSRLRLHICPTSSIWPSFSFLLEILYLASSLFWFSSFLTGLPCSPPSRPLFPRAAYTAVPHDRTPLSRPLQPGELVPSHDFECLHNCVSLAQASSESSFSVMQLPTDPLHVDIH